MCEEREREREREVGGCCFYSFLFFLYLTYSIHILDVTNFDVIRSNVYRSVVRMTQVFDLEKVSFSKTLNCKFSSEKMPLCNNGFLIH